MRRIPRTNEAKVAEAIAKQLDSLTLNLDDVGKYLAGMPNIYYNRLMVIAEAAEFEKECKELYQQDTLF
jgi:hypothetical protein